MNSDDCIEEITSNVIIHNISSFYAKNDLNWLCTLHSQLTMTVLTHSSDDMFNPMCYTGNIYDYAHSFFGEDF